jgi:excisionase family DNA binding protein
MILLTVLDVSAALSLSKSKIFKMAASGELQSVKIGRALRFIDEDIKRYVIKNTIGGKNDSKKFSTR